MLSAEASTSTLIIQISQKPNTIIVLLYFVFIIKQWYCVSSTVQDENRAVMLFLLVWKATACWEISHCGRNIQIRLFYYYLPKTSLWNSFGWHGILYLWSWAALNKKHEILPLPCIRSSGYNNETIKPFLHMFILTQTKTSLTFEYST